MPKFYAACGPQNIVVDCDTADQAAFRLVDNCLATHIWIYEDPTLSEQERRDHLVLEALLHLGSDVIVSQRGIGRSEAGSFGVPDLLDQWHRLMASISSVLEDSGLEGERCLPTPPVEADKSPTRLPK